MAKANRTIVVSAEGMKEQMHLEAAKIVLKAESRVVELLDARGGVVALFPLERLYGLWREDLGAEPADQ